MNIIKYVVTKVLVNIERYEIKKHEKANINCKDIARESFEKEVVLIQTDKKYLLRYIKRNMDDMDYMKGTKTLKTFKIKDCVIIWVKGKLGKKDIVTFVCNKILENDISYDRYII